MKRRASGSGHREMHGGASSGHSVWVGRHIVGARSVCLPGSTHGEDEAGRYTRLDVGWVGLEDHTTYRYRSGLCDISGLRTSEG